MPYWKGFSVELKSLYLLVLGSIFKNPMFLAKKSPKSYVGLYQKFLYKISLLLLTPLPPNILLTPPQMQQRLLLGQGSPCSVILKKLHPSAVISAHFQNALLTQRLGWTVRDAPPSILPCGKTAMASLRGFGHSYRPSPKPQW